jgi:hypothetical protein
MILDLQGFRSCEIGIIIADVILLLDEKASLCEASLCGIITMLAR